MAFLVQLYGHAAAKPSAMQAAARQVKGTDISRYDYPENSGEVQSEPADWRSKWTYRIKN